MGADQIRSSLLRQIESSSDEFVRLVNVVVQAMAKELDEASTEAVPPPWAKPKTIAERNRELLLADEQVDRGEYITLANLKKKYKRD